LIIIFMIFIAPMGVSRLGKEMSNSELQALFQRHMLMLLQQA